ncbi:MAG: cysteine--tRNA ligase [Thermoplasmatota archaeon]
MVLRLHNTASGELEEFVPLHGKRVHMYVCGPTVYDYCHIGHARSYVAFDTIRRYLEYRGYTVIYIQNFTDLDDKILQRARERGVEPSEVSEFFIRAYFEDMDRLGVRRANIHPRVTDHIPEILDVVRDLVDRGYAYVVEGDVYFSVERKRDSFGKLSHQKMEEMLVGARVEVDEKKRDPMDFALWKRAKPGEPGWESPWGMGRPGWHIECSTMSTYYLGDTLDIHGGGMDLIFPHHESETMQSEAHTGRPFCRYWLHNGFINVNKEKMSKSLGNFFTIREVLERFDPETVRFFLVSTHYRSQIEFADTLLEEARAAMARLRHSLEALRQARVEPSDEVGGEVRGAVEGALERFRRGMDEDFNTREAVAALFELAGFSNARLERGGMNEGERAALISAFKSIGGVLGILEEGAGGTELLEPLVNLLQEIRQEARARRDYATSDRIRERLRELGIVVEDQGQGFRWRLAR